MFKTTNRKTVREGKRVQHTHVPWPFVLHRRIAVTATIAAVFVFSLQMRDRRSCLDVTGRSNGGTHDVSLDALQDAERREESP
ncbi:MAG: hypothetical protein WBC63_01930 [Candidatus Bipolaricaulia bacterium]